MNGVANTIFCLSINIRMASIFILNTCRFGFISRSRNRKLFIMHLSPPLARSFAFGLPCSRPQRVRHVKSSRNRHHLPNDFALLCLCSGATM